MTSEFKPMRWMISKRPGNMIAEIFIDKENFDSDNRP
jgi:hypothetical protein